MKFNQTEIKLMQLIQTLENDGYWFLAAMYKDQLLEYQKAFKQLPADLIVLGPKALLPADLINQLPAGKYKKAS
jgi:hypothetical protein